MTQEVQPLTWQKRTNIEEHMQFFSKINEIIANLAPTVDEAEAAIAQATAAIASANDAIATANAASAAADAAAQSAQASAATVAGYATRLSTVEGEADANAADIEALQGRMGTAEGNITALQNVQPDYVKKAGAAQTVTSQIMVPTTATGLRDTQIANGTRIQNDLDNYAAMIRNTGNQSKAGVMTFENRVNGTIMHSFRVATYGYTGWVKAVNMGSVSSAIQAKVTVFTSSYRAPNQYAELFVSNNATPQLVAVVCKGNNAANASPSNYGVMVEDNNVILYVKKNSSDMAITVDVEFKTSYGNYTDPAVTDISEQVEDPTGTAGFVVAVKLIEG